MTPLANGQPKASERDAREWREVVAAIGQEILNQLIPVREGCARLPVDAQEALRRALMAVDDFDRAMRKIDRRGAVGGRYVLQRSPTKEEGQ